jgi:chromatin assembly factor 1 subunit B
MLSDGHPEVCQTPFRGPTDHCYGPDADFWHSAGELLASAGDDGNVILWVPSENHHTAFGSDGLVDEETWRAKNMCRSSGAEIYDLAWSPDGAYFLIGSMDNIARIYNAATGKNIRGDNYQECRS